MSSAKMVSAPCWEVLTLPTFIDVAALPVVQLGLVLSVCLVGGRVDLFVSLVAKTLIAADRIITE